MDREEIRWEALDLIDLYPVKDNWRAGCCKYGNEPSVSRNMVESDCRGEMLFLQERLCCYDRTTVHRNRFLVN